jgi:predicted metal-dependent enzyme (double-stranded beta helix superfamily)
VTAPVQAPPIIRGVRDLLDEIGSGGEPSSSELERAARLLAEVGPRLDLGPAREESSAFGRSVILARSSDGPVLAARWFPAGMPTTIHAHGTWGAMAVIDGVQQYERWELTEDGAARLAEERLLSAGDVAQWSPPDDVHRQEGIRPGSLSLIVLGRDPGDRPAPTFQPVNALERATDALRRYDLAALLHLYRPDALVDANVPQWRMQFRGPDAIRPMLEELLELRALRVTASRMHRSVGARTVEVETRFEQDGEQRLWREVHLLRGDGTGIAEHTVYCTGIWDAATIARHAAEAPMEDW